MIVIITPPRTLPDEEHIVNKLFESGLHLLHLYGLRGIHLKYNEARTFTGRDRLAHVSVSCHSFEEIDALPFEPNYVFLSPVFDSISKQGYPSAFAPKYLKENLQKRRVPVIALSRGTFIKCHRDRRRQIRLNLHTLFRSHKNLSSVNMGIEVYTLFLNLSESGKRKHLESTGISKDRLVPGHKLVQPAKLFHYLISRTHMQMISIRQFHLCSDFFKICGRNSPFNRCNCSYIHKYRSLDHSVYGMEAAALGATVPFYQFIHKNNLSHKFSNDIQPVFRNLHC